MDRSATQTTVQPSGRPRRSPQGLAVGVALTCRWLFTGAVVLQTLMVVVQPFLAGGSLDGHAAALRAHAIIGGLLVPASMALVILGVLWWRPGRGTVWGPSLALLLVVMVIAQVALGHLHLLSVHVPLGAVILLVTCLLCVIALRGVSGRRAARTRSGVQAEGVR
ncbi:hypothetical protein [Nesterenkonia sp. HG001]|uniref:hypothetical protein n=1 Tax=Nesterenkonia sp. HG001 TaxID=2983207 RepID=UPI002AC6AA13|nr:hypothetical protein [Nesterenkonia sp. HG001]MDZ5077562.1 hypothetical protein [Nesterenkonia sp. HG001]